jgi:hypothetical protein
MDIVRFIYIGQRNEVITNINTTVLYLYYRTVKEHAQINYQYLIVRK